MLAGILVRSSDGVLVLIDSLAIAGFIFAGMLFLFHLGMVGGGDVKLLAAASLLSAPTDVASQLVLIALAGGVMALVFLLWQLCLRLYRKSSIRAVQDAHPADPAVHFLTTEQQKELPGFQGDGLPYGVAICIGTLASMALST